MTFPLIQIFPVLLNDSEGSQANVDRSFLCQDDNIVRLILSLAFSVILLFPVIPALSRQWRDLTLFRIPQCFGMTEN